MTEAPGDDLLALGLEPLSIPVLGPDLGIIGPLHQAVFPGDAEAALGPLLLPIGFQQLRVHQLQDVLSGVHHHHPAENAHLGGGQSHAVGLGQGFPHIVQQLVQTPVKFFHRTADLMQGRLVGRQNLTKSHILSPWNL